LISIALSIEAFSFSTFCALGIAWYNIETAQIILKEEFLAQINHIHILPSELAARIVAGKVIERPASVVKELIENCLDAGARKINIEIQDGGRTMIRVSDDGCGITRTDLPLTLRHFATAKIRTLQDLGAVRTLGFRGQALSSIADVAHLEILSRAEGELKGSRLMTEDGQARVSPAASPVGTSVTVRDLFFNSPLCTSSLKSPAREAELVRQTVMRYALVRPEIAFRLLVDAKEAFIALPATPSERLAAVLGPETAAEMIEIDWVTDNVKVSGCVSLSRVGRSNRQGELFILNGRPIRGGLLAVMLERPYAGRLPPGRHPLAVVRIEMDPRWVDVNVHPRKAEARFSHEHVVYQALLWAVEAGLSSFPHREQYPTLDEPFKGESGSKRSTGGGLRVLGQLRDTYIVAQGSDGLVVLEQHAAHEQVLFERLLAGIDRANLASPVRLEFSLSEAERLLASLGILDDLGFEIEPVGEQSFLLRTLPPPLIHISPLSLIAALLDELERDWHLDEEHLREKIAARIACIAAIESGIGLSVETMQDLVDDLLMLWSPSICPHGRPTFVILGITEIENRFLRR